MADETLIQGRMEESDLPQFEPTTQKLITTGRTTGLPHIAVVRFVLSQGAYFVIGGSRKSDWFLTPSRAGG